MSASAPAQSSARRIVLLRACRAAAFLVVATGVADTVSAFRADFEPLWVYVATVAVIAAIEGPLIGAVSAVVAAATYDLLFSGAPAMPTRNALTIAATGAALSLALGAMRLALRRPPRLRSLTVVEPLPPDPRIAELTAARDRETERANYADARATRLEIEAAEVASQRNALQDETATLRAERDAAVERLHALESEAVALRATVERDSLRVAELQHEAASLREEHGRESQRATELHERLRAFEARFTAEQVELELATARVRELEAQVVEARTERDRASERANGLEVRAHAMRESAMARIAALDADVANVRAEREQEAERANALHAATRAEVDAANAHAAELHERVRTFEAQFAAVQVELELAKSRGDDFEAQIADARRELHAANAHAAELHENVRASEAQFAMTQSELASSRSRVDELEAQVADVRAERDRESQRADALHDAARAELDSANAHAAELHERIRTFEAQLAMTQSELASARSRAGELETEIAEIRAERDRESERTTALHEAARAELDGAKAHSAELHERVRAFEAQFTAAQVELEIAGGRAGELETQIAELRAERDREAERANALEVTSRTDRESALAYIATLEAEAAKLREERDGETERANALLATARAELDAAHAEAAELRTSRDREVKRFDSLKLALEEQHSYARAELDDAANRLTAEHARVLEAERRVADTEQRAALAEQRTREAVDRIEAVETALAEQRAALTAELDDAATRATRAEVRVAELEHAARVAEAEWSAKLQKIVDHLASDHEADIGEALMAREEARAEVRNLSKKLSSLQKTLEAERAQWEAERQQLAQTQAQPRAVVLLIHPDAALRAMAKHALEAGGHTVLTAGDGLEGLRIAIASRPGVVVADAYLPKLDGRELAQLLKSRPETANVKVILTSRDDDFLRDPANLDALRARLNEVLLAKA